MVRKNRNESIFKKPIIEKNKIPKRISKISNQNNNNKSEYVIFYKFSIASIILIFFFFSMPGIMNYFNDSFASNKIIINKSKNKFELTLNKKKDKIDENSNLQNVYDDIDVFSSDEENTNTSRLSASTIEQLFKDIDYSLEEVRKTKKVQPIRLSLLPNEIKEIENSKKRKSLFIKIILPLILEENNRILLDRKRLFSILNKNKNSKKEINWLNLKFKQYGVLNKDIPTLKVRMDIVPVSLALAQAAKETGWGTSRFALEGNALFGQWTWSGEGIKPAGAENNTKHKVMKFKVLKASVRAYQRNLNTHTSYKNFRQLRAQLRDDGEKLDSLILADQLDNYAETGKEYTKILKQIIQQNSLRDFDEVKIMPLSAKYKNLI